MVIAMILLDTLICGLAVETLRIISNKLKNPYWKNVNQKSCSDGGQSFNQTVTADALSHVVCDCSFNRSTVCHVTHISMKGLGLSGVLPAEFGNLTHLQEIDLSRNYLSGTIPTSLSKIPLVNLSLLGNRNTGLIPDEIGHIATLEQLILEDNQLGGPLPQSLGNLKNLGRLLLSGNNFSGTIPETFGNLTKLTDVRFNGNNISGKIPDFIGNWTSVTLLEILGTSMTGPIPSTLSLLTNLTILRISDLNTTSMSFPNLAGMTNLQELVLRNCFITGQIPDYFRNLSNLKHIDLSFNQLSGQVPDSMRNLKHLQYLYLTNNSLSGTLPNWILNSKQNFDVSYNNFTGSTPASCQVSNVNLVASYASEKDNSVSWCLMKDLPCPNPQYDSLFINCGGHQTSFEGHEYDEDSSPGGPSTFFAIGEKWAYSSTGSFLYNNSVIFVARDTSNPNVTSIYQTARLAPISLKYYGLCLREGSYTVKLHFAEIMFSSDHAFSGDGRRIFDVAIQGNVVLKDFNIAAEAGGAGKEIVKEFNNIYVNGSTLEVFLYWAGKGTTSIPTRSTYGPLISGISVTPNFKTGKGLSPGAIIGIVLASCVVIVSILVILRMTGYLGRKVHENEELQGLDTGYFSLRQIKAATDDFSPTNK